MHPKPLVFPDIVVHPTASVIGRRAGAEYSGGPLWPDFEAQLLARHCREEEPVPFDAAPPAGAAAERIGGALWCGPVCSHFGHAIADFGGRILESAHLMPDRPLLFTTWPGGLGEVPAFFGAMLAHLGVDPARVILRDAPVRVQRLWVYPQAERLQGPAPEPGYLDLLDRHAAADLDPDLAGAAVFVSRSRVRQEGLVGRIAGEAYLDEVMAAAGVRVLRPEEHPLPAQLRIYRSARLLVFSEGSALHGLQLQGRIRAEVAVIPRRPRARMARAALKPRAAALHWLDATAGLVAGLRPEGTGRDRSRGVTVLDGAVLRRRLAEACGIHLAPHWDEAAWTAAWQADVRRWVQARRAVLRDKPFAPQDAAMVAEALGRLGLDAAA